MHEPPRTLDRHSVPVEGDLRLPTPPGVIRRFWYRHPRWTDSLIAVVYVAVAVAGTLTVAVTPSWNGDPALLPFGLAVVVFGGVALLFRRSRPWSVVVASWVVTLLAAAPLGTADVAITALALYALAVYGSVRGAWIAFGGSAIVGVAAAVLADGLTGGTAASDGATVPGNSISSVVLMLVVVLVGINVGNRRRYVVALLDRAAQLARERDQQAQLATAAERSRIAREIHDIVSHGLTVMVTLAAGSAATAATQPERAADAMLLVADTGRQALADMRRMLGVLDDGTPGREAQALEPQPGIAELGALVEGFRSAGLGVNVVEEGLPPSDAALQLTVYRLVQESLTNVLRHSPAGAAATVTLRYGESDLAIDVTNDGRPPSYPLAADESGDRPGGHGIVGMRERVALYGGSVTSEPRPGGGWAVAATLKHEPPPPAEPSPPHERTTTP